MDAVTTTLAAAFAQAIGKDSVEWVNTKIQLAQQKKELLQAQNEYEAIIQTLLNEKLEIQRIAQQYQQLYDGISITDEDFRHLHESVSEMLELLLTLDPNNEATIKSFQLILNLINVNLLKSMQLIGFDFKEAIGRPLTRVCANAIDNLSKPKNKVASKK